MRRMVEDSIDEQVATIVRALNERKTRQFTSQNSGMSFKQIQGLDGTIPIINSPTYGGEAHVITSTFIPAHNRPAVCMPSFELSEEGFKFDYYRDYSRGYESVSVYDLNDNYIGYMDIWAFYHETGNGYNWQTVVYTWGTRSASIPFHISLRATDDGSHTYSMRSATL